jgi:outer membrane protein assembly factor BamB
VRLGDAIFAASGKGQLMSLNAADGKLRWALPPAHEAKFYTQAPIVDGSRILFSDPADGIVAVEAASGRVVWRRSISSQTPLLIRLAGRDLYAASQSTNQIYRVDAETGVLEDTFSVPATPMWRLAATERCVLTTLEDNSLLCVDRNLTSVRWRQILPAEISTKQPFVWADSVLVGTATGVLSAFRLADGAVEWSYHLPGRIVSVANSGTVLYVGTLQGVVTAIRLEGLALK